MKLSKLKMTDPVIFPLPQVQDEESDISEESEENLDDIHSTNYQSSIWLIENQHYEGDIFRNSLHGQGFYFIEDDGKKTLYDGMFYLNELEGYSHIFYHDHSHFQGLFKQNKRFGPGVFTYPDSQAQDVGFWQNSQIIRLSVVVESGAVPSLANTASGKCKLMKYKCLVPICEETRDIQSEILQKLEVTEEVLQNFQELYNNDIQNRNSLFFNKKLYDEQFFGNCDNTIEVPDQSNIELYQNANTAPNKLKIIERTRNQIQKCEDQLEMISARKQYLQGRIDYCKHCCQVSNEQLEGTSFMDNHSVEANLINLSSINYPLALPKSESKQSKGLELSSIFTDMSSSSVRSFTADVANLSYPNPSVVSSAFTSQNIDFDRDFNDLSGTFDMVSQTTQQIVNYCVCAEDQHIDDLPMMENQMEEATEEEMFYLTIKENLQIKLDRKLEKIEEIKQPTRKITVTEICPWNSDETLLGMFQHCFRYRNFESLLNFKVASLLYSKREDFISLGSYEETCIHFLKNCLSGNHKEVIVALRNKNVNPDVSDAKGNTGVFFAVSRNQVKLIPSLANFGANLNKANDEGLTPLTLCILKYIAISGNFKDWEMAFLQETTPDEDKEFFNLYPIRSFLSLSTHSLKKSSTDISEDEYLNERIRHMLDRVASAENIGRMLPSEKYAFNLNYKEKKKLQITFGSGTLGRQVRKSKIDQSVEVPVENVDSRLRCVLTTILTLLNYGVDPRIGDVPYPPLICSLFTENSVIVKGLLEASANPNITIENNLTPLHIVTSLNFCEENINIIRHLLDFGANPNMKASSEHWKEQKELLLGHSEEQFEDNGKNPLQLLCMRKDHESDLCGFFENVSRSLANHKIDANDFYLGHTALSLAVLMGNSKILGALLDASEIDPYLLLQYDMGNVLTVHALKKYENFLEIEKTQDILEALVINYGVNPLHPVGEYKNCIEFIEKPIIEVVEQTPTKGKAKPKKPKKPKTDKKSYQYRVTEYLKTLCRQIIIKRNQMRATQFLYDFTEENLLNHQNAITLAEILVPELAAENLTILFNSGAIPEERFDKNNFKKLLDFVNIHQKVTKTKKGKEKKQKEPKPKTKDSKNKKDDRSHKSDNMDTSSVKFAHHEFDIDDIIANIDFKKPKSNTANIPGMDDFFQYNVCYNCLKAIDKALHSCSRCEQILYCSEQCNKLGLKLKTLHTCDLLFYTEKDAEAKAGLLEMAEKSQIKCEERMVKKIRDRIREENDNLYKQWRADKYGNKFWNRDVLKERMELMKTDYSIFPEPQFSPVVRSLRMTQFQSANSSLKEYTASIAASLQKVTLKLKSAETVVSNLKPSTIEPLRGRHRKPSTKKPIDAVKACACKETLAEMPTTKSRSYPDDVLAKFKVLNPDVTIEEESKAIVKNTRKIPKKYWYFLQLLSKYCLDVDMSFWYLPYACYSDGQLYYKFLNSDIFTESYSLS